MTQAATLVTAPDGKSQITDAVLSSDGKKIAMIVQEGVAEVIYQQDIASGVYTKVVSDSDLDSVLTGLKISQTGGVISYLTEKVINKGTQTESTQYQLFASDVATKKVTAVSHGATLPANKGIQQDYSMSPDGRYLAFASESDNLVKNDYRTMSDIFMRDLQSGKLERVSYSPAGAEANNHSYSPSFSSDGQTLYFHTYASNLTSNTSSSLTGGLVYRSVVSGSLTQLVSPAAAEHRFVPNGALQAVGDKQFWSGGPQGLILRINGDSDLKELTMVDQNDKLPGTHYVRAILSDANNLVYAIDDYNQLYPPAMLASNTVGMNLFQYDYQTKSLQILTHDSQKPSIASGVDMRATSADGKSMLLSTTDGSLFDMNLTNWWTTLKGERLQTGYWLTQSSNVTGGAGSDALPGSSGADALSGGAGNDQYLVNNASDAISEISDNGTDTAYSMLSSYTLPDNVENLTLNWGPNLSNSALGQIINGQQIPQTGTGNSGNNFIQGSTLNNELQGMAGNDTLTGGAGNDTIDGGAGKDVAYFMGNRADYEITLEGPSIWTVKANGTRGNPDGTDVVKNVELLTFADTSFSFGDDIYTAQAYRMYRAILARDGDATGLGYWARKLELGVTLNQVAEGFIRSAEFYRLYGFDLSNENLVRKLYHNVLQREGEAEGIQFWTNVLNENKGTKADVLVAFSESTENKAALVGIMDLGFEIIPYTGN
ncbi:DUF4214 domain-containing protein [Massilia sp. W12]|uniref:DUF4214 domain-containing protein n=1 Tax=Massilia sp. W12 TaxID=3126507 RepID=UPI0030D14DE0